MDYFKEEKEISIKELLFSVVLKWRSIISIILITMVASILINSIYAIRYIDILGKSLIISAIIKQVVINAIVSGLIMGCVYAFVHLFTDTIKSVQEFTMVCNMSIVGCIANDKVKNNSKIDKLIKKSKGIKYKIDEIESQKEYIAKVIERSLLAENTKEKQIVAIVSSCSVEYSKQVTDAIKEKITNMIEIIAVDDINNSPSAIDDILNADYIIFAESEGKSKYYEFDQAIRKIQEWNKKILGIILVNVDAI